MPDDAIIVKHDDPCSPSSMPILVKIPGREAWINMREWWFVSSTGHVCVVPAGFVSDLDSVPRIPFIYAAFKGRCVAAVLAHDWEYSQSGSLSQADADRLMREIAYWEHTAARHIEPMYRAVQLFGNAHYRAKPAEFILLA